MTVTVYTAGPACAACTMTKRHLSRRAIPFAEVPIDSAILAVAAELGLRTAPIVRVESSTYRHTWDGYRPDRIDALATLSD
jgi:glutaredoxin-like protein NrdH